MDITNFTTFLNEYGLTGNQTIKEALPLLESLYGKDNKTVFNFIKKNINVKLGDIIIKDIADCYNTINPVKPITPPEATNEYLTKDITIVYHDNNCHIEKWPITFDIKVTKDSKNVNISTKADLKKWSMGEGKCWCNIWALFEYQGKIYTGACEFVTKSYMNKAVGDINGAKIERQPVLAWVPKKGDKVGIFVTGLARGGKTNVKERSSIVWVTW